MEPGSNSIPPECVIYLQREQIINIAQNTMKINRNLPAVDINMKTEIEERYGSACKILSGIKLQILSNI